MNTLLWWMIGVLVMVIIVLFIKIHLMRKSAQEIIQAFEEKLNIDSNTLMDISSRDKYMLSLAASINTQLRQLRRQRQRYQQGNMELKDAVTNVAHDLRTPLTAICGYLDLLEGEDKSETVNRYISMISNRTEALKNLTEELFKYSVTLSFHHTSTEKVILNRELEQCLMTFYGTMEQQGISPEINISQTKVERKLNPSAISRILENIISNALKYSEGDFQVIMDENGKMFFINTASSLSSVEVGKLFDRFFTVETGRNSTGLGLSIAKVLTEEMGGHITANYENSKLMISVYFPETPL